MTWKLTVRQGPRVQRLRYAELESALDELERIVERLADEVRRNPLDTRLRQYQPGQQVAARVELAGPQRLLPSVRAGIDVHGDGSDEAYTGRLRRQAIKRRKGEKAARALRRSVAGRKAQR